MGVLGGAGEGAGVSDGAEIAELVKFDKAVVRRRTSVLRRCSSFL
jgi:hypothetical protein